ncbi:MAG: geranylgeranylglycerol-phosphate geranylgeranyltransferase [Candidatus Cloacimonetes bacterium]|nr:geranylgeranylglycerol-phosphate geranylgeranyltransferase [Candidatus Cloacimonadota bacterium]
MAFIKIIRPFNCIFVFLSVFFGAYYLTEVNNFLPVFFAACSAFLIAAAGYVINDFFDIPIDIVNRPERILPSRKITPQAAYIYAVMLFILGITASYFTQNLYCVLIAILNSILLFSYARYFKVSLLLGNLIVSLSTASIFLYGGLSNNNLKNSMIIFVFAFLGTFLREIVKDGEDIRGDLKQKAKTLAVRIGRKKIAIVAILPVLLIIIYTLYLFYYDSISMVTLSAFIAGVALPLIFLIYYLYDKSIKARFTRASMLIKIDMLILLIILWVD